MWTEADDEELEYGKWYEFDVRSLVAEDNKIRPPHREQDIWPHWDEGRPAILRRRTGTPVFYLGKVSYRYREYYTSVVLRWNIPLKLSFLKANYRFLPRTVTSEWSGVYRIFARNTTIDRSCGRDPTGTLYLGRAGGEGKNWSILRTRIMAIVNREHHATTLWSMSDANQRRFPWSSLAVEWAYTGTRLNHEGRPIPEARLAETWLLASYNDSYGELPPWNQRA